MPLAIPPADLAWFRALVTERLGLLIPDDHLAPLAAVLSERLREGRHADIEAYRSKMELASFARRELAAIAEALTVGETYFFRVPDQWAAFAELVLPELLRTRGDRPLRLLSAGCATGEEAYTMAMLVRERLEEPSRVRIQGIDVNEAFVARAREGRYSGWSLRATTDAVKSACFKQSGREYRLLPELRRMVDFEARNMLEADAGFWHPAAFDLIMCRNVSIYFSPEATRALIARFASALAPGGYLFLGPAETLRGVSLDFELHHTHGTFYYRLRDGVARPGALSATRAAPEPAAVPEAPWVEAIGRASERISALAEASARPPADAPHRPAEALAEARALFGEERFAEALAALKAMPDVERRHPDALLLLAAVTTNLGLLDEAERACQDVLAIDALSAGAHYMLALCRDERGDTALAAKHDEMALHLDPTFAMPHLHLGLLAKRAGDLDAAGRSLKRARALLEREDAARILLFGGGFRREALQALLASELRNMGGAS